MSVGAGPPPRQTPPSRRRRRSGSGAVERHGLSHHRLGLLPLPSLHPGTGVLTHLEGPETSADVTYSRCIHGLPKPAPSGQGRPSLLQPTSSWDGTPVRANSARTPTLRSSWQRSPIWTQAVPGPGRCPTDSRSKLKSPLKRKREPLWSTHEVDRAQRPEPTLQLVQTSPACS